MKRNEAIMKILAGEHIVGDVAERITSRILETLRYGYRSDKQNSYYWAVIVTTLANNFGYSPEEMHDALKLQFLRVVEPGKPDRTRSTAELSTIEAEEYYETIRAWALTEYGINIPLPNEVVR